MKELERTKRISISTVVFILVLVIGILTFKKPSNVYEKTTAETLKALTTRDYLVPLSEIDRSQSVMIDIRDKFDYSQGHLDNALNIPTVEILKDTGISIFNALRDSGKTIVLYGKNPHEANRAWMILYQLGYGNIKILENETRLVDNDFQITGYEVEKPIPDYLDIFQKGKAGDSNSVQSTVPETPKKVMVIQKKKKRKPEGGC